MKTKVIPIRKNPTIIIVSIYNDNYIHFHLDNSSTKCKRTDIGCWHVKYKSQKLDE
jgi:hypothetical protein